MAAAPPPPQHSPVLFLRELLRWTIVIVGGAVVSVLLALAHIVLSPVVFIAALLVSTYFVWNGEHVARLKIEARLSAPEIVSEIVKANFIASPPPLGVTPAIASPATWIIAKVRLINRGGREASIFDSLLWVNVCGVKTRAMPNSIEKDLHFFFNVDGKPAILDVKPSQAFQRLHNSQLTPGLSYEGVIVTFFHAPQADVDLASVSVTFRDSFGNDHEARPVT